VEILGFIVLLVTVAIFIYVLGGEYTCPYCDSKDIDFQFYDCDRDVYKCNNCLKRWSK